MYPWLMRPSRGRYWSCCCGAGGFACQPPAFSAALSRLVSTPRWLRQCGFVLRKSKGTRADQSACPEVCATSSVALHILGKLRGASLLAVMALWLSSSLAAQETGGLSGFVWDPSGALVAGASITAMNEDTGFRRVTETDAAGSWDAPYLYPGRYKLTVRKEGFRTIVQFGARWIRWTFHLRGQCFMFISRCLANRTVACSSA